MKKNPTNIHLICLSFFLMALLPVNVSAQAKTKDVNTQSQSWFSVNSTIRINKHFGILADAHMRRNHFLADPSFYFLRAAVNYWIKDNLTVAAGLGQMWVAPTTSGWHHFAIEKRIYQQGQLSSKLGKVGIVQRLRNEQRWQEKIVNDKFTNSYKFTDRIRYLLSLNIPVSKNKYYPSITLADELAIQFGKEVVYNTFDQNRIFIGLKQQVCKNLSFDIGYMLVYQEKASGIQYDKNNTFRWFFYYTPDLRKKK